MPAQRGFQDADRDKQSIPPGMRLMRVPSPLPYYIVGALWLLYALAFPMYRLTDYAIVGVLSAGAFFVLGKVLPMRSVLEPIPYQPSYTGDDAADTMLLDGQTYLNKFREANVRIEDAAVSASIERVCQSAQGVLDHIAENPHKAKQIRRFIQYYLPTVDKLLQMYNKMESQRTKGENIRGAMESIASALGRIADAFDKQLDALFMNEAIDINADICVLEGMLKQEGLTGGILTSADASKAQATGDNDDDIKLKI